ncbi:BnaA01g18560D [Brassica napus]|uniref:BnaA01g18560D protein n=1 Tax=Brassica napus TaxID=3708 RepID=A0A078GE54_BRANA|nr:BnaA01g18560D [Brassica napus]
MRTKLMEERVNSIVSDAVEIEREFVCDALPCALVWMTRELMSQYIEGKRTSSRRELVTTRKLLFKSLILQVALYVGGLYICGKIGWESVMKMGQDTRELFFYETFLYYNPLLLITMMVWLWGVNLWVFSRTGVDYAAIFYLGPDHHSHKEIWKCARWMTTITLTSMTVYLYLHVLGCFSTKDKTETPVVVEEAKTEEKDEVTETLAVVEEEEKAKAEEVVAAGEVAAEKTDE